MNDIYIFVRVCICFNCCASNKQMTLKCNKCESVKHSTTDSTPVGVDGKREDGKEETVLSSYTDVCRKRFSGKLLSKICLVNVRPANDPSKSRLMYTMLNNQSN